MSKMLFKRTAAASAAFVALGLGSAMMPGVAGAATTHTAVAQSAQARAYGCDDCCYDPWCCDDGFDGGFGFHDHFFGHHRFFGDRGFGFGFRRGREFGRDFDRGFGRRF